MAMARKWTAALLVAALAAAGLTGCAEPDDKSLTPGVEGTGNGTYRLNSAGQPIRLQNQESAGVLVRNDLAMKLNRMHGVRNATVLMHNGNAYVGVTTVGDEETVDPQMKRDPWRGNPYGTATNPKSASGMTVEELAREQAPNADTHLGPHSTDTGHIPAMTRERIVDVVKGSTPGVQQVYVTGNLNDVEQLSGFRNFVTDGGNMGAYEQQFVRFLREAFPTVKNP